MTSTVDRDAAGQSAHVRDCGCRTDAEGRGIADMRCLTSAQRTLVIALINAAERTQTQVPR